MLEWFAERYIQFLAHVQILFFNPTGSAAAGFLRMLSLVLLSVFAAKYIFHIALQRRLRRSFPRYTADHSPETMAVYRNACVSAGLRRRPPLRMFSSARPLIFTIGILRPAVYMAPRLAERLTGGELKAVLVHELQHIRRRDALYAWFLDLVTALIPAAAVLLCGFSIIFGGRNAVLIPAASALIVVLFRLSVKNRLLYAREIACDDMTISVVKDPLLLADSLVKVWRLGAALPEYRWQPVLRAAQPFITAAQGVEPRVKRLIDYRRPASRVWIRRAFSCAAAVTVLFLSINMIGFYRDYGDSSIEMERGYMQVVINKKGESGRSLMKSNQAVPGEQVGGMPYIRAEELQLKLLKPLEGAASGGSETRIRLRMKSLRK